MIAEEDLRRLRPGGLRRPLVAVLTPWRGLWCRRAYLRACLRDSFRRGEAPWSSLAAYAASGVLCDEVEAERALGLACGRAWELRAGLIAIYEDFGVSDGMAATIAEARAAHLGLERRRLGPPWGGAA